MNNENLASAKQTKNTHDKGEGSIFLMSNGKWRASITVGKNYKNGNPIRKTFTCNTEKEAKKKLKEFKGNIERYSVKNMAKIPVYEFFDY